MLEALVLTGKSSATRVAGVEALSLLCFVGSEGASDTLHTMQTLWRVVLGGALSPLCCTTCGDALSSYTFQPPADVPASGSSPMQAC